MADVRKLKPFILKWEGGFVDDPADLGGATNKGVTIGTYKEYRKKKGLPEPTVEDLKKLSDDEWTDILKTLPRRIYNLPKWSIKICNPEK